MRNPSDQSNWQKAAACRGAPSYLFFPEETLPENRRERRRRFDPRIKQQAIEEYCQGCPVKGPCLEYAILHDLSGIWAGTDDSERNALFPKELRWELRNVKEDCDTYQPLYGHA